MNVWRPKGPGDVPTLGHYAIQWAEYYLASPDKAEYTPLVYTPEQREFILNFYMLEQDESGIWRRKYRRGVYSRPKGSGKSPLLASLAIIESLADIVPDGFNANGRPIGKPWREVRTPLVQLAAVSADQTMNAWAPLLEMIRESKHLHEDYFGIEPYETKVNLPGKGWIEFVTSAATSREGNRPVFCVLDQTEAWTPSNGGRRLAATMRRNLGKTGGTSIESPNAYEPGAESVAEDSAEYWRRIQDGSARDRGLLYDHREASAGTDMSDKESLLQGLREAYGDSAEDNGGWVDLERIVSEIWDPATDPSDARRFYLNQVTHASDSWLSSPEVGRIMADESDPIKPGDSIMIGFDGSKGRAADKIADATALIGCRVRDGRIFEIGVWEQPTGAAGRGWRVPEIEVDTAVDAAHKKYQVWGMFGDPPKWESYIAKWEAKYSHGYKVKSTHEHPIEFWTTSLVKMVQALAQFHTAIIEDEASIEPGSSYLVAHLLHARRRSSRAGMLIAKEHPDSSRKIDAAIAATLAWEARTIAVSKGIGRKSRRVRTF